MTQCLAPTLLYTDVDGQGDKLTDDVTSLPHTGLGKNRFLRPTSNFDRKYLCKGTMQLYQINNRKETRQCTRIPRLQIWLTLVHKRIKTMGEFLPTL